MKTNIFISNFDSFFYGRKSFMTNKMTVEERDQHNAKKIETPAAKAARLKEEQRVLDQMAMNKDSNSI